MSWLCRSDSGKHSDHWEKYIILIPVLSLIPFLEVYEGFYASDRFQLRNYLFDIQKDYIEDTGDVYSEAFPQYGWRPDVATAEGLGRRKNVVILTVKSLAVPYSEYFSGLAGYTPELDRLAAENVPFLNYHSAGVATVRRYSRC